MKIGFYFLFIIFFSVFNSQLAVAQEEEKHAGSSQISFSPLRLIDPVNPGLELGLERTYGRRLSTQLSVGYMKDFFNLYEYFNGWRVAVEERIYLNPAREGKKYLAIDVVHMNVDYGDDSYFQTDTTKNASYYTDTFDVSRKSWSFNIRAGIKYPFKRFFIDLSAGLGVKYRMTARSGFNEAGGIEREPRHPNARFEANKEGNFLTLSVPANVRVGYRF
ncbi:MAG TPA: hypothetical protein VKB19_16155 [Pedobacter sp.]|nr:hypothetical protein [Pedobacter sp.]